MEEGMRLASLSCSFQPKRRVAVVGLPGTGKWTLAQRLSREYCWCHIDASRYSNSEDIPSQIASELQTFRCSQGAVITSFPSTASQSQQLQAATSSQGQPLSHLIELGADSEALLKGRVTERLVHEGSGRRYQPSTSPSQGMYKDDRTGEGLVCRLADSEEGFRSRWEMYDSEGVFQYFTGAKIPTAGKSIDEVWKSAKSCLF